MSISNNDQRTPSVGSIQSDKIRLGWQKKLLPVMTWILIGLAIFFFIASLFQLIYVHRNLQVEPSPDIEGAYAKLDSLITGEENAIAAFRAKSLVMLEANAMARRYHQANSTLMTRVWIRYLGFVTGMILSIIGAVFILGKLESPITEIKGDVTGNGYSIRSASPGIILTFFGVVLMITTIVIHHPILVEDQPLFTSEYISPTAKKEQNRQQLIIPKKNNNDSTANTLTIP